MFFSGNIRSWIFFFLNLPGSPIKIKWSLLYWGSGEWGKISGSLKIDLSPQVNFTLRSNIVLLLFFIAFSVWSVSHSVVLDLIDTSRMATLMG